MWGELNRRSVVIDRLVGITDTTVGKTAVKMNKESDTLVRIGL